MLRVAMRSTMNLLKGEDAKALLIGSARRNAAADPCRGRERHAAPD